MLACALGHSGKGEEARRVAAECERLSPGSTETGFIGAPGSMMVDNVGDTGSDLMMNAHYLDGLRKAGLPE